MVSLSEDNTRVQVKELGKNDSWLYHSFPLSRLGLEAVML
jgi:hypothetical protein